MPISGGRGYFQRYGRETRLIGQLRHRLGRDLWRTCRRAARQPYESGRITTRIPTHRNFDIIAVMDDSNYERASRTAPDIESIGKIHRMTDFATKHVWDHIPDPYYEGAEGFELVLDLLEDCLDGLLNRLVPNGSTGN